MHMNKHIIEVDMWSTFRGISVNSFFGMGFCGVTNLMCIF